MRETLLGQVSLIRHKPVVIAIAIASIALSWLAFIGTKSYLEERASAVYRRLETEAFPKGATGPWLLRKGWSPPESWGTWSNGPTAELEWPLRDRPRSDLSMWIDGRIYPHFVEPPQKIRVTVNGTEVATLVRNFEGGLFGAKFKIPLSVATARRPMRIVFEIANPTSPQSINDGTDPRKLGIGLKSIELEYDTM